MVRITNIQLKKDLFKVYQKLSKVPTKAKYNKYGAYNCATFCRRFGSWNKALKIILNQTSMQMKGNLIVYCRLCNKKFTKRINQIDKTKNNFCSKSCAAIYNNTHKTKGTRRSKLEVWLETQLPISYPNLQFLFNDKTTINSELDIYIPKFKLAFELNGIFHYEPIFGINKLLKIQNNDNRKFQACLEKNIELCIIDASSLKYFKPDNAKKYLKIICNIIDKKCEQEESNFRC